MNAQLHNFCLLIGWQLLFHGPQKVENKMKQTDLAKHKFVCCNIHVNALWVCDEQKCTRKWLKWNCILKPVNKLCACSEETEAPVVWKVRKIKISLYLLRQSNYLTKVLCTALDIILVCAGQLSIYAFSWLPGPSLLPPVILECERWAGSRQHPPRAHPRIARYRAPTLTSILGWKHIWRMWVLALSSC